MMNRFSNIYGCQNWHPAMICWGLGGFGVGLTGALKVNTKEDMAENSRMIVLWGANIASQPNTARHIISAPSRLNRKSGRPKSYAAWPPRKTIKSFRLLSESERRLSSLECAMKVHGTSADIFQNSGIVLSHNEAVRVEGSFDA
jgi:hypothetical protein